MRHVFVHTMVLMALAFAVGCAPKQKPPTLIELEANEVPYLNDVIAVQQRLHERLIARLDQAYEDARRSGRPEDATYDILVLSGGGAKGAFGAGFLVGWGEVTDPAFRRPNFDFVSGVSTGSLMAPMAFVGDDESYRVANGIYRNPSPEWVKSRGLLDVLINQDSIYTNQGLFDTISGPISARIPQIAAEGKNNRILVVASVNLNQGQTRVWDLTQLASDVQAGNLTSEEFCRRVFSSASIPLVFPPQLIDNNLYVDGSTTSDILISFDAFWNTPSIPERWNARYPGIPFPKLRLWVIANTPLFVQPVAIDSSDLSVVGRALDLSVQAALLSQLKNLQLSAALLAKENIDVEFRYVAMPSGWTQTGDGMFNKADMQRMSDLGMAMGRDPKSWQSRVPNLYVPAELRNELMRETREAARKSAVAAPAPAR